MATSGSTSGSTRKRTSGGATSKRASGDTSSSSTRASKRSSSEDDGSKPARRKSSAPRTEPQRKKKTGTTLAAEAAQQLLEVTGREVEGVTALERTENGWRVQVEVLEVRRIPDTTDILALYDLDVDSDGELVGYRRTERYIRGTPGDGGRA